MYIIILQRLWARACIVLYVLYCMYCTVCTVLYVLYCTHCIYALYIGIVNMYVSCLYVQYVCVHEYVLWLYGTAYSLT